jgi:SAM-dependent methyltransferase
MAERGAIAHGADIAAPAIQIAQAHYASVRHRVSGVATYEVADLNQRVWPSAHYDLIAAKGILHHLPDVEAVIRRVHAALVPGGLFWVCDTYGGECRSAVLAAGLLMLILPTHVSYYDKLRALARFGRKAPDHLRASMEAEGLSPFEGAGRAAPWPSMIASLFEVDSRAEDIAITGYIAAQLKAPDPIAVPFLRLMGVVDRAAVRAGLLRSTGLTLWARKPAGRS